MRIDNNSKRFAEKTSGFRYRDNVMFYSSFLSDNRYDVQTKSTVYLEFI